MFMPAWNGLVGRLGAEPATLSEQGEPIFTFRELDDWRHRYTERLSSLAPGSIVLFQDRNRGHWPAFFLATLELELVLVPVEVEAGHASLQTIAEIARANAIFAQDKLTLLQNPLVDWGTAPPALLKMTSGTTAAPRAIRFTETQLLADCQNICTTMGIELDDRNFGVLPFSHSYGFSNLVTPLLYQGTRLVCSDDRVPRAIHQNLLRSSASIFPATPAIFRALADLENPGGLGLVRLCVSAGAPLPTEVSKKFYDQFGLAIHSFYGSSECGGITYDRIGVVGAPTGFVGSPVSGVEILRLEDERIEIRSAAVGSGYYPVDQPEILNGSRFRPGDLVRWSGDEAVLHGRATDSINIAGRKVHPGVVETHLRKFPGVEECVVFGVPSPNRNEEIVAIVQTVAGTSRQDLEAHCRSYLPDWQVPRVFKIVGALPLTARGKVDRPQIIYEYRQQHRS